MSQFHMAARNAADANRYEPGTPDFNNAVNNALQNTIPDGALFDDNSRFYHIEGQYNFSNHFDFANLILGANFRQFQLRSNGTIFDDEGGVNINEWGTYLQASKSLLDDQIELTGSLRYDKNENFDGQFSPRLSGVFTIAENQNIRASFQTGFRNPTTQGQYIDLNVVTARLLGGLQRFADAYEVTTNSYTIESVQQLTNTVLDDPTTLSDPAKQTAAISSLEPYSTHEEVQPEQIQAYEVGYKGLFANKLFIDAAYYYNIYDDFITQIRVRKAAGSFVENPSTPADFNSNAQIASSLLSGDFTNTFQIYTNFNNTVEAHGAVFGLENSLPEGYRIGFNYNWNKLITDLETFQNDFNTPEHKINATFGNRNLTERLGFNIAYRWQDAFRWESSFAFQDVEAVSMLDAQVSYRLPQYNSTIKVGGSNLFNNQYTLSAGGPQLGAIYYVSLTFDQLFR
ncbi:MAG: TonB-dependent receptor [Balneolaceae bacterium]|nr:TonB-dependent receptor [Balneolaceae bacterium]